MLIFFRAAHCLAVCGRLDNVANAAAFSFEVCGRVANVANISAFSFLLVLMILASWGLEVYGSVAN